MIEMSGKDQSSGMMQTICLLPTTFMLHNLRPMSGLAKDYTDRDVRFYQLFGLGMTCGLYHALCASRRESESKAEAIKSWNILAPTMKESGVRKVKSSRRVVEDQFIVPDGLEDDDDAHDSFVVSCNAPHRSKYPTGYPSRAENVMSSFVDGRRLFEVSFLGEVYGKPNGSASPNEPQKMLHYLHSIYLGLEERKKQRQQGMLTL